MNYELALQLKKAGFPQEMKRGTFHSVFPEQEDGTRVDGRCYEPTLSELIEVCGEKFFCLQKESDGWKASAKTIIQFPPGYSTPEEAVGNLYLALHEAI